MQKSKVLSLRLPLSTLQGCYDLCNLLKIPAKSSSTAISRSLVFFIEREIAKGTLERHIPEELDKKLSRFKPIVNPTSLPSLESSSIFDSSEDLPSLAFLPSVEETIDRREEPLYPEDEREHSEIDQTDIDQTDIKIPENMLLEEEILRQVKELELEDELDLLSKILISG